MVSLNLIEQPATGVLGLTTTRNRMTGKENGAAPLQGEIKFAGIQRCADEAGHEAFEVLLPGRPPLFGEWDRKFSQDGNNFSVVIVSFGFFYPDNLTNDQDKIRALLTLEEVILVEELVRQLLSNPGNTPFGRSKLYFTGKVSFLPGWARYKSFLVDCNHTMIGA